MSFQQYVQTRVKAGATDSWDIHVDFEDKVEQETLSGDFRLEKGENFLRHVRGDLTEYEIEGAPERVILRTPAGGTASAKHYAIKWRGTKRS